MDEERVKRIDAFLAPYGASMATLPTTRSKQLEKVDEAIQGRLAAVTEAQNALRKNCINVSTISTDTGISRKTFYNNELLRLYVEQYAFTSRDDVISRKDDECEALRNKNEVLSQQIQKLVLRDIETENLRQENLSLGAENERLNARIASLEKQYEQAQTQLCELRSKVPFCTEKVVSFPHI